MYNVAICEDEPVFAQTLERICRETLDRLHIEYQITHFSNSESFSETLAEEYEGYDIILLDIVMDGMDGMTLAHKIRETDKNIVIIFISGYDFALQSYDVNAFHYFSKPIDETALSRKISQAYADKVKHDDGIFIKTGTKNVRISLSDIVCLETKNRHVEVSLINESVYYNGKLTDLLPLLPQESFVRCHQSFVVNMNHIIEVTRKDAIATNGKKIPISRTYMNEMREALLKCFKELHQS